MNSVEDIIINKQAPKQNDNKKVIMILIFIAVILLAGACGAYYWFTHFYETPKAAFFRYFSQTNIPEITDTSVYYNILERMNNANYETTTEADFTTTEKTDFTQNVDVSNFLLTIKTSSNKDNEEAYIGANITYRDNPFFDVEIVSKKDNIGIGSSEVLDKYIATSKYSLADSLNRTTGNESEISADTVNQEMKEFADNRINLDEEYKKQKVSEYLGKIMEKIPEEAVTLTENSPITISSDVINTKAYALKLDGNSYREIATSTLTDLKNDTELLGKLVTGEASGIIAEPEPEEEVKTPKPITIQRVEGETVEHETAQEIETEEPEAEEEAPIPVNLDENEEEPVEEERPELDILMPPDMTLLENSEVPFLENEIVDEAEEEEEPKNIFTQLIEAFLFEQKLDMSVEELQIKLDEELQNLDTTDGLEITVYVRDVDDQPRETIKVLSKFSSKKTLDIEYPEKSKAKVTFLEDVTVENEEGEEITTNKGSSIEIKRASTDVETSFNIVLNTIEEQKVVAKLELDLTTKGSGTSKTYNSEFIIKNSDSEGDSKINIRNTIDFHKPNLEKEITEENAIFVDRLTDEEASNLYANIIIRLMGLYSDKILNMNFVDVTGNEEGGRETVSFGKTTADALLPGQVFDDPDAVQEPEENTNTTENNSTETPSVTVTEEPRPNPPETQTPQEPVAPTPPPAENNNNTNTNTTTDNNNNNNNTAGNGNSSVNVETISKADVRNMLAKQMEAMISEAHRKNREFSIKDLSNLPTQIEGMNVSTIITDEKATVKIAGYTFYIDKDLMLTEE